MGPAERAQVFAVYKKTIFMALVLLSLGPLTAEAGNGDEPRDHSKFTLDLTAAGGEKLYLGQDGMIYRETNRQGGLQPNDIKFSHHIMPADKSLIE